ncbi:kinetochore-associated Ndc80 complex subunit spc24 [Chytriomyces hyalinus]|nr:kinetochore-associated Ndc80 complex subunit spc24 [Chytriomyces hyalinus]
MLAESLEMDHDTESAFESIVPHLLEQLDVLEDAASLSSYLSTLNTLTHEREAAKQDAMDTLKRLSLSLEKAKRETEAAQAAHAAHKHANHVELASIEDARFRIAKQIQAEEKSISTLESRRAALLSELEALKAEEELEASRPPDESVLKLNMYKSLGIDLVYENDTIVRCHVRSVKKNDIMPLDLSVHYSRYFYANILWEMCSS